MASLSLSVPSERSGEEMIRLAKATIDVLDENKIKTLADQDIVHVLWHTLQTTANGIFTDKMLRLLSRRIPDIPDDDIAQAFVEIANTNLDVLSELYTGQLAYENAIPPPSSYAKPAIWAVWQQKATAILCFRPSGKQGLPLCVLNNVFREFQQQVTAPLPSTEVASPAMDAALDLCHTMPNNFATESERGDAFDRCLDRILPRALWRKEVQMRAPTELRGGQVDGTYEKHGVVCILREDKLETGSGEDVYMQVSRVYQLYVETVRSKNPSLLKHGVPVFLLCVLGPMLLICGGFHDVESTIVEPLAEPCLMFDDHRHIRQKALARQLLALKRGIDTLCSRGLSDWDAENHQPAGVPRVYTTYTTEDNTEQSLRFLSPLEGSLPRSLLFIATDDPQSSSEGKLVKLVEKYGVEVHRLLAENQLAPALYGQRSLESAPTAYIMEFLPPPTITEPGWVTLFEVFKNDELAPQYSNAIRIEINRILKVMDGAKVVHGDLRPNNIMLEVNWDNIPVWSGGGERCVNLRVVDFDWAGQAGVVKYPLHRNRDITWPGGAGKPISAGDDRDLVQTWWRQRFSSML